MAITQTYVDYGTGNDYNGASFTDGAYTSATKVLAKNGAFTKTKVNHWLYLSSNAGGSIVAGYYKVATATDANSVILATDAGGGVDATDVKCTQATGTALLPFRSIQGALDIITRDATNGDQINIKAGTTQTLSAALTLVTYGTPTGQVPLKICGYTSAADDGGIGVVSGDGTYNIFAAVYAGVQLQNMHFTNGAATGTLVKLGINSSAINCEVDTGTSGIEVSSNSFVIKCYVHDCSYWGINLAGVLSVAVNNYLVNGSSKKFGRAIMGGSASPAIVGNIVKLDSSSSGVWTEWGGAYISSNSIWSSAGTGTGINVGDNGYGVVLNNIIEGFSGVGGKGIFTHANARLTALGYNVLFNNATPLSLSGKVFQDFTAFDIALGASPFTNPAGGDFSVSTALKALGFPASFLGASTNTYIDIGAAQRQEPAGGAVSISPTLGSVGAA